VQSAGESLLDNTAQKPDAKKKEPTKPVTLHQFSDTDLPKLWCGRRIICWTGHNATHTKSQSGNRLFNTIKFGGHTPLLFPWTA